MRSQKTQQKLDMKNKLRQDKVKLITHICQEFDPGNYMYDVIRIMSKLNDDVIYDRSKRFKIKLSVYHLLEAVTK